MRGFDSSHREMYLQLSSQPRQFRPELRQRQLDHPYGLMIRTLHLAPDVAQSLALASDLRLQVRATPGHLRVKDSGRQEPR